MTPAEVCPVPERHLTKRVSWKFDWSQLIAWAGDLHEVDGMSDLTFSISCFHSVNGPGKKPKCLGRGSFGTAYVGRFSSTFVDKDIEDMSLQKKMSFPLVIKRQVMANRERDVKRETFALRTLSRGTKLMSPWEIPVVVALGFFVDKEEPRHNLVMEFAPGSDLDSIVRHTNFTQRQLMILLKQCLESVAFCHTMEILHRDIKPNNYLLNAYGKVILADFGLSIPFRDVKKSRICGTTLYMAPEVRNQTPHVTHLLDIYGVGAVAFYALCKSAPGITRREFRRYSKAMAQAADPTSRTLLRTGLIALLNSRQSSLNDILMNCRRSFPEFVALAESPFVDLVSKLVNPVAGARPEAATVLLTDVMKDVPSTFSDDDLQAIGSFDVIHKYREKNHINRNRKWGGNTLAPWLAEPLSLENHDSPTASTPSFTRTNTPTTRAESSLESDVWGGFRYKGAGGSRTMLSSRCLGSSSTDGEEQEEACEPRLLKKNSREEGAKRDLPDLPVVDDANAGNVVLEGPPADVGCKCPIQ